MWPCVATLRMSSGVVLLLKLSDASTRLGIDCSHAHGTRQLSGGDRDLRGVSVCLSAGVHVWVCHLQCGGEGHGLAGARGPT